MLRGIGEAPISSLVGNNMVDVSIARDVLLQTSMRVQAQGWWFNTEKDYPLARDASGFINIPTNVSRIDTNFINHPLIDPVQRGTRMYDMKNHTYVFTQDLLVDVQWIFPYEELPESAREYIAVRAARIFARDMIGSETADTLSRDQEYEALAHLQAAENENLDFTIFGTADSLAAVLR